MYKLTPADNCHSLSSVNGLAETPSTNLRKEQAGITTNPGGGPQLTVTRYALGARGIDAIETTTSSGASAVYPVYDGHGNMIATLSRNGTSYTRANNRTFDAWGIITSGSGGDQGYVANLGHRKDVESSLSYMRARYYEPATGRFISEDTALQGGNWFGYCLNNPVNFGDPTGRFAIDIGGLYWIRFDHHYSQEGTGDLIQDLTWGRYEGGQKVQMGSIRPDGTVKHGTQMTEKVKSLVRSNLKAMKKIGKAAGGRYGLAVMVLTTTLDSAFLSDPYDFGELIDLIGGEWELLGGWVTVTETN